MNTIVTLLIACCLKKSSLLTTGICSFDGLIYTCGGYDGASCLSSMERYDPLTGVWTSCPPMTTRRRYCRVAVVGKYASEHSF